MNKTHRITIRVDQSTYNQLKQVSDETGYELSKIIRDCIKGDVRKYKPINVNPEYIADILRRDGELLTELNNVNRELHMIGNNVNQIAKYVNTNGYVTDNILTELTELITDIQTMRKEVNDEWQSYMLHTHGMETKP